MDKAGRATDPSLMVAPSGRDIDPDEETVESTVENEVMTDDADADTADADGHTRVPFPADEIGKPKGASALADPADGAGAGNPGDAAPAAAAAAAPAAAAALPANGRLDNGRQAVRQAMAATNSWFATRSSKSDPAPEPAAQDENDAGQTASPAANARDARPSFAPSTSSTSSVPTSSSSAVPQAQETAGPSAAAAGRSLWRDAYASSQSAPSGSGSGTAAQPSGSSYAPSSPSSGSSRFSESDTALGGGRPTAAQSAYTSSVTAPWQNRDNGGKQRKREATVRRSARRQAQLTLARVEPWSVMKFSFVVSVVAFIILFVAVAVLYMVLSALGVFDSLQHTVSTITSSQGSAGTNISNWFSASRILGYTGMLGALNIVLITAISTIGSVIYNLIARTIGGIEVTLRETD